ncbi:MAG: cohesin domain-containing protein [Patescibacteria group bacterium]
MASLNNMKIKNIALASLAILALAAPMALAGAGTITVSPATREIMQGQTFTMSVNVNPAAALFTAKAVVRYPANLLEVKSFSYGSQWLPLTQAGYDGIDNASGVLVKTAGYPGGLSATKALGTITFKAKATGTATITVGSDSALLDANSANTLTSGGTSTVTIKPYVAPSPTAQASVSASPSVSVEPSSDQAAQLSNGGPWQLIAIIALVALAIVSVMYWKSSRRGQTGSL